MGCSDYNSGYSLRTKPRPAPKEEERQEEVTTPPTDPPGLAEGIAAAIEAHGFQHDDYPQWVVRTAVRAAYPTIERAVREKIAREIEAVAADEAWPRDRDLREVARIARGEVK